MTYLEISDSVPAMQVATQNSASIVDYEYVQSIERLGSKALRDLDSIPDTNAEITTLKGMVNDLGNAVIEISMVLGQIVRGLEHKNIHVSNYPTEQLYLDRS